MRFQIWLWFVGIISLFFMPIFLLMWVCCSDTKRAVRFVLRLAVAAYPIPFIRDHRGLMFAVASSGVQEVDPTKCNLARPLFLMCSTV